MVGIIVWFTLGAIVGVVANILLKTDDAERHPLVNVAASIVGAVVGGTLARLLGYSGQSLEQVLTFQGVLFAGVGAALMLLAVNLIPLRRHAHR